ncbi:MAG: competence/damage-inducible protein A [Saprospiraceae bacterium]|jgi:nicotinamide-nucleotide amidase|nr:competence/damage-inducible protein A [Saprospiraceae bacterium]
MDAIIVTVGDEILIGQVVDTNSAWLGQKLAEVGIRVKRIMSLADDHGEIVRGLALALGESDIVFMTGGLGPTKDDITKKAVADFMGVEMLFHQPTYERIKAIFERMGRPMFVSHEDQCLMPVGADILKNSMGTAPGMLFDYQGKRIISMPGVPYEMKAIMEEVVLPMLKSESKKTIIHKTILTCGAGETSIENAISDLVANFPENLKIAYLPALAQVRLRLSAEGQNKAQLEDLAEGFKQEISERLADMVYGYGDSSLENELYVVCKSKGITVSTAESCTGGLISSKIVSIPGSSAYFKGAIVAYANDIKENMLHVDPNTIHIHGAVSEQTVIEMVNGAIDALNSDVAVAVSGIAGPDGGSPEKPVGTIWICAGNKSKKSTFLLKAGKDRNKNIEIASVYALSMLRKFIIDLG